MRPRLMLMFVFACLASGPANCQPKDAFDRITPAQAGYSAEKLDELRGFLEKSGSDSLLLLHEGKVFFEWGDIRKKRLLHSMRKALLNSLYGIAEAEGKLDLGDDLAELGIDDIEPSLTPGEKTATLEQLLQSRSGVYHRAAAEAESMERGRPARGSHAPGEFYYYNNWDFNVAGRVYERRTGERIYDAFEERIAKPLGMLDYHGRVVVAPMGEKPVDPDADGYYQYERERSDFPAYHFRMSAHDLALYGQLYLQHGQWKGKQIVPADWIDRSTQARSIVNEEYGLAYGMLWDVLVPGADEPRPSFFHTGVGVHMLAVYPKRGLVMVHRVDTETEFRFREDDLYQIIRRVHGARLAPTKNP
ncbi:serine hydrolase domain-containing protein [Arenimonas sp.]|uniref:serine hydrolase domain-containing protein n=1 Tax=Arenimonas sp. TaxID=1872635 RepID=UPI0039E6CD01